MLRESGINDEMEKIALNPRRLGPDIGQTQTIVDSNFETLIVSQMKGIFYLYTIINFLSLLLILFENILSQNYLQLLRKSIFYLFASIRKTEQDESQIMHILNTNYHHTIFNFEASSLFIRHESV